ncbi:hypothetical protein H072_4780 [Dactylellina haptotyla CBS 200.50]|uniref:Peptidase S8/S53 domain-containing protein n=1 Tax=Dactylellina haptotyla (strain CBS 200.50) TaxID=1284197 RepID=S8AE90_DACHA|nr:hypothetical protein H072_4780 [Dactylellina haptotyla CBS 200.50]
MPTNSVLCSRKTIVAFLLIPVALGVPVTPGIEEQKGAPWHLGRISSNSKVIDLENLNAIYRYPKEAGEGVDIYVSEKSLNTKHPEFITDGVSRAKNMFDVPSTDGRSGHGTLVAGVAGSNKYGVAKKANIIAARTSSLKDILKRHKERRAAADWKGSVVNISWGTNFYMEQDKKDIENLIKEGVHIVTAAGNEKRDACVSFPGGLNARDYGSLSLINVGATDGTDRLWEGPGQGTNTGSCVDIWAPGAEIWTTTEDLGAGNCQGTSFSAPMVAGVVAVELSRESNKGLRENPTAMKNHILSMGFRDAVLDGKGNKLVGAVLLGFKDIAGQSRPARPSSPQGAARQKEQGHSSPHHDSRG